MWINCGGIPYPAVSCHSSSKAATDHGNLLLDVLLPLVGAPVSLRVATTLVIEGQLRKKLETSVLFPSSFSLSPFITFYQGLSKVAALMKRYYWVDQFPVEAIFYKYKAPRPTFRA